MLKPVSILALDDAAAPLAHAVQQRVAANVGLDDLVQTRAIAGADLAQAIQSIHAQRQRPDSPLRLRDDIGRRELVLVMLSAAGPARTSLIETAREIRGIYESRRFAAYVSIEILCLLPEVCGADDYAGAYALLKALGGAEAKPFSAVWLLDATNGRRVKFGALDVSLDVYADAIAGSLVYEPELSGALPGHHPRGMHPTFSSFGYAALVFPRDVALQRIEARFAAELIRMRLLAGDALPHAQLAAKQVVAAEAFAAPLSRIGIEAGQSLFRRFQPRAQVSERTRMAEEVIAAVRNELQAFRDSVHLQNLETLAKQGEQTTRELIALLSRTVDEILDRHGYAAALDLLDALLDPLPELRPNAELSPRNLVTEIRIATAALDEPLRFIADTAESDAARKRVRELEALIQDQQLVADTVAAAGAAGQLEAMEREKSSLLRRIPEVLFAEERENNAARNAAREAEAARLATETETKEQALRELFAELPRVEQALTEALEDRRAWLWRQSMFALTGLAAIIVVPFFLGKFTVPVMLTAGIAAILFAVGTCLLYISRIAPRVREAREGLARLRAQLEATDQAKNAAHNAELQYEYDVRHRQTSLRVLGAIHEAAKESANAIRTRRDELDAMAASFVPASIVAVGMSLPVVDDGEVDAWYERTIEDRKPFVREFPIERAASRHLPLDEMRRRIAAHASSAFGTFGKLTLGTAAATLATEKLAHRLKRFVDNGAPLIDLRDDDLEAQRSMQRDRTLWVDAHDAKWTAQLQRQFPEAQVKASSDALSAHVVTRVLHYPGYVLGQIDYYRARYDAAANAEGGDLPDLLPAELVVGVSVRDAYERLLLARSLGIVTTRTDGQLSVSDAILGNSHLTAAQTLASPDGAPFRELLETALVPRLEVTRDVSRELRTLRDSAPLTPLDRNVLDGLLRKYPS